MAWLTAWVCASVLLICRAQGPEVAPASSPPGVTLADALEGQDAPLRPAFRFRPPQINTTAQVGLLPEPAQGPGSRPDGAPAPAPTAGRPRRTSTVDLDPSRSLPDFHGPVTVPGAPHPETRNSSISCSSAFLQSSWHLATSAAQSQTSAAIPPQLQLPCL